MTVGFDGRDFHDFELACISIDRISRSVRLILIDPATGLRHQCLIAEVARFAAETVALQNVVLDVEILTARTDTFEFEHACALLALSEANAFAEGAFLTLIQSSVGAEIACLSASAPVFSKEVVASAHSDEAPVA